jgi:hypothetical protein
MSAIQGVLVSLLTTFGGAAAIGWLLKTYIDRKLQYEFKKRERLFESDIKSSEKYVEHVHDIRLRAAPEIHEIAYRIRNKLKEDLAAWTADDVLRVTELSDQFVDCLYRYRIFLPAETFSLLHKYKGTVQRVVVYLSQVLSRPSSSRQERRAKLASLTLDDIKLIEASFSEITSSLADLMQPPKGMDSR